MSDISTKDDILWGFIARCIYAGVAFYALLVLLALIRDFIRNKILSHSPGRSISSVRKLYFSFSGQYRDTYFFYYVELVRLTANLLVCVFYVLGTYRQNVNEVISIIYRICACFVGLDVAFHILYADSALSAAFDSLRLVDAFSIPSLLLAKGDNAYLNFTFLRAVSAYSAYGRLERRMFVHMFSSRRLIVKLAFQCVTLFYTLAAGIQLLEVPGDLLPVGFRTEWSKYGDWNFLNATYFIIVTLSTVGYGDFSPSTMQGRIYTLFIIIVGIVVFTSVISELGKQASEARGSGYFVKNARTRHVVVTGTPTLTDLVHFVSEFYSDTRQSNASAKIVVLVEQPNWSDTDWFQYIARNQFLQNRLQFLMGSPLNATDLQRAKTHTADAVFILTSPSTGKDPTLQDTTTIMNVLAVRNTRNDLPIFAQTILEDSNLQTFVALRTPVSESGTPSLRADTDWRASYQGLFHSVVQNESDLLQLGTNKFNRRHLQGVYRRYRNRHDGEALLNPRDPNVHALKRSQHVCLQEIHMALISGNIKANGVGTLISNMYLDVQPVKISKEEPAWLSEYHMGAACSLVYVIIPDELDGVSVKEIANDMYHLGLLLIATSDPKDNNAPRPVLSVSTTLTSGHLGMVLTYHQPRYVAAGFLLTALRHSKGNLRHLESKSPLSRGLTSVGDKAFRDEVTGMVTPWSKTRNKSPQEIRAEIEQEEKEAERVRYARKVDVNSSLKYSHSADDLETLAESENLHLVSSSDEPWSSELPEGLKGHIIIAMEGSSTLQNLALLLKNLWRRDKRKSSQVSKRPRIVVIHPSISDQFRRLFSRFKRYVFFVEGSPASRSIWKKAKLSSASSVATVADYTQPWHVSDARTIFTLLTLDCSTAYDQDLFICSELIEEKSLEFLREPMHARRAGASLGECSERLPSTAGEILWPSTGSHSPPTLGEASTSTDERQTKDGVDSKKDRGKTLKFLDAPIEIERQVNEQIQAAAMPSMSCSIDDLNQSVDMTGSSSIRSSKNRSLRLPVSRLQSMKAPGGLLGSDNRPSALLPSDDSDAINTEARGDPANRPGADRARRGTLFSRSRYASGELLVQSSAITLLAREYIEPGFVSFFTNILGTDPGSLGMKIRLVRIPKAMFDPERGYTDKTGRPLIRFNDVFRILVRLGVTPLGIYRSGSAPVLIPWKARRKRGSAVKKELDPLLETLAKTSDESKTSDDYSGIGSFMKHVFNEATSITPGNLREQQGRDEVRGRFRLFFSNDEDDSSDEFDFGEVHDGGFTPKVPGPDFLKRQEGGSLQGGSNDPVKRASQESPRHKVGESLPRPPSRFMSWRGPRLHETQSKFVYNDDQMLEVPGRVKYMERPKADNLLPYVYTLPDPNTWCAETDGVFILCAPSFELPSKWLETSQEENEHGIDSLSSFPM